MLRFARGVSSVGALITDLTILLTDLVLIGDFAYAPAIAGAFYYSHSRTR